MNNLIETIIATDEAAAHVYASAYVTGEQTPEYIIDEINIDFGLNCADFDLDGLADALGYNKPCQPGAEITRLMDQATPDHASQILATSGVPGFTHLRDEYQIGGTTVSRPSMIRADLQAEMNFTLRKAMDDRADRDRLVETPNYALGVGDTTDRPATEEALNPEWHFADDHRHGRVPAVMAVFKGYGERWMQPFIRVRQSADGTKTWYSPCLERIEDAIPHLHSMLDTGALLASADDVATLKMARDSLLVESRKVAAIQATSDKDFDYKWEAIRKKIDGMFIYTPRTALLQSFGGLWYTQYCGYHGYGDYQVIEQRARAYGEMVAYGAQQASFDLKPFITVDEIATSIKQKLKWKKFTPRDDAKVSNAIQRLAIQSEFSGHTGTRK